MLIILDMHFGYLLVISEFIWAIRQPYNNLVQVTGHFKETRIGAWVEAVCNITISIILVNSLGIIGVTIGTIIAMVIRTAEFVYHSNKYILKRRVIESVKKILVIIIETVLIFCIAKLLPSLENNSIGAFIINGTIYFVESICITMLINMIIYKSEFKQLLTKIKSIVNKN